MAAAAGRAASTIKYKGLRTPRIRARADHSGGTDVPLQLETSQWLKFIPWVSENSKKEESKKEDYGKQNDLDHKLRTRMGIMKRVLEQGGCKPGQGSSSKPHTPSCDGTFRCIRCQHHSCIGLSFFKQDLETDIASQSFNMEQNLYNPTNNALKLLTHLANRVEPRWPGVKIYQGHRLNRVKLKMPDFVVTKWNEKPLFAVEVKHPRMKLRGKEERVRNTPRDVAGEYSRQFGKSLRQYEEGGKKKLQLDSLQKAIIQTCFYALSIDSGLAVLYTFNEVIFFRASPKFDERGNIQQIELMMSEVYECSPQSDKMSSLEALFSFMSISPHAPEVQFLRETQQILSHKIDEEKAQKTGNKEGDMRHGGSSSNQGSSSKDHKSGSSSRHHGKHKHKKTSAAEHRTFVSFLMSQLIMKNMRNLPNRFENVAREERIKMLRDLEIGEYWNVNIVELEDMFMKHYHEVIGEGASGTVVRADIGEFPVAIKVLNVNSEYEPFFPSDPTPLDMLENEVEVYKRVAEKYPELLGSVMPHLYAVLEDAEDTALVTEYVGEKLEHYDLDEEGRSEEGRSEEGLCEEGSRDYGLEWYVDGERLSVRDRKQISEAATEAMGQLLDQGIRIYDRRPDNLRVERITDEKGEPNWKVWWIDFGLAEFEEGKIYEDPTWELDD